MGQNDKWKAGVHSVCVCVCVCLDLGGKCVSVCVRKCVYIQYVSIPNLHSTRVRQTYSLTIA